jgi:hypothetical protein
MAKRETVAHNDVIKRGTTPAGNKYVTRKTKNSDGSVSKATSLATKRPDSRPGHLIKTKNTNTGAARYAPGKVIRRESVHNELNVPEKPREKINGKTIRKSGVTPGGRRYEIERMSEKTKTTRVENPGNAREQGAVFIKQKESGKPVTKIASKPNSGSYKTVSSGPKRKYKGKNSNMVKGLYSDPVN